MNVSALLYTQLASMLTTYLSSVSLCRPHRKLAKCRIHFDDSVPSELVTLVLAVSKNELSLCIPEKAVVQRTLCFDYLD